MVQICAPERAFIWFYILPATGCVINYNQLSFSVLINHYETISASSILQCLGLHLQLFWHKIRGSTTTVQLCGSIKVTLTVMLISGSDNWSHNFLLWNVTSWNTGTLPRPAGCWNDNNFPNQSKLSWSMPFPDERMSFNIMYIFDPPFFDPRWRHWPQAWALTLLLPYSSISLHEGLHIQVSNNTMQHPVLDILIIIIIENSSYSIIGIWFWIGFGILFPLSNSPFGWGSKTTWPNQVVTTSGDCMSCYSVTHVTYIT